MSKVVGVLGTLDSKGEEYAYLKREIEAQGVDTLIIDVGVLGPPIFTPDVSADEVARVAGHNRTRLAAAGDRGEALSAMGRGAAEVVARLAEQKKIHGLIAMGGGGGSSIGAAAMQALPLGFPKLLVSTLAAGDTRAYVGATDITMMPSIVDIAGINRLSSRILSNAAGAIAGMVKVQHPPEDLGRRLIAATMFGVTTPCVMRAREELEKAGYEVLVFHAVGTGGRMMEELIRRGYIAGVLDITTTELADELVGGILSAGARRLEAAGEVGIPQVVCPGGLDMVNFAAPETVPARFAGRLSHRHTPAVTLMRTSADECAQLGAVVAAKLRPAKGPTVFVMPMRGFSSIDVEGAPFYDPQADMAFLKALKANLPDNVRLVEIDSDINSKQFAGEAAKLLLESMAAHPGPSITNS